MSHLPPSPKPATPSSKKRGAPEPYTARTDLAPLSPLPDPTHSPIRSDESMMQQFSAKGHHDLWESFMLGYLPNTEETHSRVEKYWEEREAKRARKRERAKESDEESEEEASSDTPPSTPPPSYHFPDLPPHLTRGTSDVRLQMNVGSRELEQPLVDYRGGDSDAIKPVQVFRNKLRGKGGEAKKKRDKALNETVRTPGLQESGANFGSGLDEFLGTEKSDEVVDRSQGLIPGVHPTATVQTPNGPHEMDWLQMQRMLRARTSEVLFPPNEEGELHGHPGAVKSDLTEPGFSTEGHNPWDVARKAQVFSHHDPLSAGVAAIDYYLQTTANYDDIMKATQHHTQFYDMSKPKEREKQALMTQLGRDHWKAVRGQFAKSRPNAPASAPSAPTSSSSSSTTTTTTTSSLKDDEEEEEV